MQDMLTLKEIARQLGVPESNLRYYKNRIGDFLPSVGKGRKRRYLPESIEIFKRAIDLIQGGMTLDRVYKHLAQENLPESGEAIGADAESRDVFIAQIVEKLKDFFASEMISGGNGGGEREALKQNLDDLRGSLSAADQKIASLEAEIANKTAIVAENERKIPRFEADNEMLRGKLEEQESVIQNLTEQLKEKERIIEVQKGQLLDAREKRLNITEELRQIRQLVEESRGAS